MGKSIPKVLIVGLAFGQFNGGGITLNNLFSKFPKYNLAVLAQEAVAEVCDLKYCKSVYQLGSKELKFRFPYSIFKVSNVRSGPVSSKMGGTKRPTVSTDFKYIKKFVGFVIRLMGFDHVAQRYEISDQLDHWIRKFDPDIVYCQMASVMMMRLVRDICKRYDVRLVVHTPDDWPPAINRPNLLYLKWKKTIHREFKRSLQQSSASLVICELMGDEYLKRYGKKSEVFYNPVDLKLWGKYSAVNKLSKKVKILYLGSINISNDKTLNNFAKAVESLNESGRKIEFYLYSTQCSESIAKSLSNGFKHTFVRPPIDHSAVPELISKFDYHLLPLNFDNVSRRLTRLSFSTKTSECMASKKPIIVCADKESAYCKEAVKYNWGFTVIRNSPSYIKARLLEILDSFKEREIKVRNAYRYANDNCEIKKVSSDFLKTMQRVANDKN